MGKNFSKVPPKKYKAPTAKSGGDKQQYASGGQIYKQILRDSHKPAKGKNENEN